jgi:sulfofructose kinase
LKLTDYAIFSAAALREFARSGSDADRLAAALAHGPPHAGVTLGPNGYRWAQGDGGQGHQPGFKVDAVDTTGAGDAFHGAFALMVAEGRAPEECARAAAAVAAMKCRRLGSRAGLPTRAELNAFLAAHG